MDVRPSFDNPFQRQVKEPGPQNGLSPNAKERLNKTMAAKAKGFGPKGMAGLMKMGGMGAGASELSNINQQVAALSESLMGQTGSFNGSLQSSLNTTLTSLGNASTSLSEANDRLNRLLDMEGVMGQIPSRPVAPAAKAKPAQNDGKTNRERRQEIEQLDDMTASSAGDTPSAAGQAGTKSAGSKASGVKGAGGGMPVAKSAGENNNAFYAQNAGAAQMAHQLAFAQQSRFMSGGLNFKA